MKPLKLKKGKQTIYSLAQDESAFLWNPENTVALLVSVDLLNDWLADSLQDDELLKQLEELLGNSKRDWNPTASFVSIDFDSSPCDNVCSYCPIDRTKPTVPIYSPYELVELTKTVFPNVSEINISGPDNAFKYSFLQDTALTSQFTHVNANVNIRNLSSIVTLPPNVAPVWGGTINDFVAYGNNLSALSIGYMVIDRLSKETGDALISNLPKMPFASLTLEPNFFDETLEVQKFLNLVRQVRDLCDYEITGMWDRPATMIGRQDRTRFCASCTGMSVCLHNTGFVSVCGYLPHTQKRFRNKNDLQEIMKQWKQVLKSCDMPESCLGCEIRGLCQGGCRVLHHQSTRDALTRRCELMKTCFYMWVLNQLAQWNESE